MNFDLSRVFPKASKSFLDANKLDVPVYCGPGSDKPVQPIVATRRGKMNKTEAEFAMILEAMKRKGEILRYEFEGMTLRWFDMRYTPDFVVIGQYSESKGMTGTIKFIEVKGAHIHYSQQAMARFKGARGFWPEFTFEMHQKQKSGWTQII